MSSNWTLLTYFLIVLGTHFQNKVFHLKHCQDFTLATKSMPSTPIHWSEQLTTAFKTRSQHAHLQSYNAHGRSNLQNHVMRVKTEETVIHRFQIYIPQTGLTDPRLRQKHLSLIAFCIFAWSLQHKQKTSPNP